MKKIILTIALFYLYSTISFAGYRALTHHSRANCAGFNESVTWWYGNNFYARVESHHYPHGADPNSNDPTHHDLNTGKEFSWRHAAYHATESYGGSYSSVGLHYMYVNGKETLVTYTKAYDCAIYDGWWDY